MRLFHGSYIKVEFPETDKGRGNVDFGQGFYLTSIQTQAERWAKVVTIRKGPSYQPTVSVYEIDMDGLAHAGFSVKSFEDYDMEWLEYVVDCRKGGEMQHNYDLVEGGMANDNVIDTVEDFETGRITAEQALGQLLYKNVNHQLCVRSQQIIDEYLHFVSSYQVQNAL